MNHKVYIEQDKLIKRMKREQKEYAFNAQCIIDDMIDLVESIPAANIKEVKNANNITDSAIFASKPIIDETISNSKAKGAMKVGIIYNWKGLKEENFLYTLDELAQFDFDLLQKCIGDCSSFHDSAKAECGWKTWSGRLLKTDKEIKEFLSGKFNDEERKEIDEDWYWENQPDNDLYGRFSPTMKSELNRLKVS